MVQVLCSRYGKAVFFLSFLLGLMMLPSKYTHAQWTQVGNSTNGDFYGEIYCVTKDKSGNLYAAGYFKNSIGKNYVAKWDGSTWSELGGTNNSTFNYYICTLTTDAAGNVYAAGTFRNSNLANYVAKWNGSSWSELGGTNNSTFIGGTNGIQTLTTDAAGNIYAAGYFTNSNGKQYVAKWNGSSWSEIGGNNNSTFNSSIFSLTTDAAGNLYASGEFRNSNGNQYVARWNGSSWSELGGTNASTFNNSIVSITTDAAGNIYTHGGITNSNGKFYVSKWNGSSWSELGGTNSSTFNGRIYTLTIDTAGNIYAAGYFTNSNGKQYVAKWNGSSWTEIGGTNNSTFNSYGIYSLTINTAGNIYAAGAFTNSNGKQFVAKYSGIPTPLTLTTFTAQATEANQIKTTWQTATETNTSHFNIQRSSTGKDHFTTIATLQAAGNSTHSNNYSYTDIAPLQGISFYRLQSVDKDGSSSYSKVVPVQLSMANGQLSISPNPAKDVVNVKVQSKKAEKAVLQIINIAGKVELQQTVSLRVGINNISVPIGSLLKGNYVVSLITDSKHYQERLIKE